MREPIRTRLTMLALPGLLLAVAACRWQPDSPLTIAAAAGSVEEAEALLAAGAEVDARDGNGLPALVWAARNGHVSVLKALLDAGADPTQTAGSNDWTPLQHAIHKHQNGTGFVLLRAGADVRGTEGARALAMAAGYGNAVMVRALLDGGADPRRYSGTLGSAVGGASDIDYRWRGCEPHTETVRALLQAAPDLRLRDSFGDRRALDSARRRGCTELVALVEHAE